MKKNVTIILSILMLTFLGFAFTNSESKNTADSTGISFFKGTWEEALLAAKKENKLIFVDAYAVWCGPCKTLALRMQADTIGEYYNANFINFKMDIEKNANGPRLARKWGLRAYPTLYFVKPDESTALQSVGLLTVPQLLELGAKAKAL